MKLELRLFYFLDEIGVWLLLLALLFLVVLVGRRIKNKKIRLILFALFLAATVVCEFILQRTQTRGREFFLIGMEFLTVPACLGFGVSALLHPRRREREKSVDGGVNLG